MILAEWLGRHPEADVHVIETAKKPEILRRLGIRGTPSLLVQNTKTGKTVLLEGLARRDRLDQAATTLKPQGRGSEDRPERN